MRENGSIREGSFAYCLNGFLTSARGYVMGIRYLTCRQPVSRIGGGPVLTFVSFWLSLFGFAYNRDQQSQQQGVTFAVAPPAASCWWAMSGHSRIALKSLWVLRQLSFFGILYWSLYNIRKHPYRTPSPKPRSA